jgi:fatty acid desaturase
VLGMGGYLGMETQVQYYEKKNSKMFSRKTIELIGELQKKDNYSNLLYLGVDWLIIVAAIFLVKLHNHFAIYIISIFIIASRQRAFDNLTHEASHGNLLKNTTMNNVFSSLLTAFPIFTSLSAYRQSHFKHHRYLSEYEHDPDLKRYKLFGLDNPPNNLVIFYLLHILLPATLVYAPRYLYGTVRAFLYSKDIPFSESLSRSTYWIVIITMSIYFNFWGDLLLFWVVPYVTVLQIIRYYAEMSEHAGLMQNTNPLMKTRNVFGNKLLLNFFYPHHDHYHLIHHLFAGIPHYNLPKAHNVLMKEPTYCAAKHCIGYFYSPYRGINSVIDDIRNHGQQTHICTLIDLKRV